MSKTLLGALAALVLLLCLPAPILAQNGEGGGKNGEEAPKTIAELTQDAVVFDGLFTLYRDPKTGKAHMRITEDQLDREYIYWVQVANGVLDAGFFKGAYGPSGIIEFRRNFDTVQIVQKNTAFYFDPDSPLARAADANISDAILAVQKLSLIHI